ncbi:hypothetical protein BAE44_0015733 [Dichanthelium oligosanthes]|uniref:Uncharacterized protein n=1 Tax=Dichanthelium oligosanthes TaxID=888268 RepID=A0A1E5VDN3_9POAL|nr:hypothetical protein BAE44_0015733 [Dichanthelium oligosanthes]
MTAVKSNRNKSKPLAIALTTTGALLFLAFAISLIWLICKKLRQRNKSPILPPSIEEHYERVSYHTLANGTNGFSEANLLDLSKVLWLNVKH